MVCRWCNDGYPLLVVAGESLHDLPEPGGMVRCEATPHYAEARITEREPLAFPVKINGEPDHKSPCGRKFVIHYSDGSTEITTDIDRIRALVPEHHRPNWS